MRRQSGGRGGAERGQGRRVEQGQAKLVALRFHTAEEEAKVMTMSPRARAEACLAWAEGECGERTGGGEIDAG